MSSFKVLSMNNRLDYFTGTRTYFPQSSTEECQSQCNCENMKIQYKDGHYNEARTIVFFISVLMIITGSEILLFFRARCVLHPKTWQQILKSRRDLLNKSIHNWKQNHKKNIQSHRYGKIMEILLVKRTTKYYERQQKHA